MQVINSFFFLSFSLFTESQLEEWEVEWEEEWEEEWEVEWEVAE